MTRRVLDTFSAAAKTAGVPPNYHVAPLAPDLLDWLADLLILRHVPLAYLVPHPDLLPPESIRFFHVDPNFTAHLLDGALAAADLGQFDRAIHQPIALAVRAQAEQHLLARLAPAEDLKVTTPTPGLPLAKLPQLSGFLLRSEIVRRWPGLLVTGWDSTNRDRPPLLLARKDRLASGLLIVLFAGVPRRVEIAEPPEGVRFGAERQQNGTWSLQRRDPDGRFAGGTIPVKIDGVGRLDVAALKSAASIILPSAGGTGSGHLALCLQQTPSVQVFQGSGPHERRRIRRVRGHLGKKVGG